MSLALIAPLASKRHLAAATAEASQAESDLELKVRPVKGEARSDRS